MELSEATLMKIKQLLEMTATELDHKLAKKLNPSKDIPSASSPKVQREIRAQNMKIEREARKPVVVQYNRVEG